MISLDRVTIRNGSFALRDVSMSVSAGAYAALMGPTGCGKTSLLETVCGLLPAASGTIRVAQRDVTALHPAQRGVGYVPQDGSVFTTMTVRENLGFALRVRRWGRREIDARVEELAALLGIGALLERSPIGLSGGEAQRVALGRALAARPAVLCLDEPFNALDAATRDAMGDLVRSLQRQSGVTVLHVTHDATEARRLADELFRIEAGAVVK